MSTPAPAPRLTKKQQKAAAHKKGVRKGKGKGKQAEDAAGDLLDVPEDDLGQEEAGEELAKPSKKRKRAAEDDDNDAEADADADGTDGEPKKKLTRNQQKRKANRDRKQRFIVFVGEWRGTVFGGNRRAEARRRTVLMRDTGCHRQSTIQGYAGGHHCSLCGSVRYVASS